MIAYRVDQQAEALEPDALQDLDHQLDDLGVHHRGFRSDGLRADLEELAVAAFLRPLAAEHRADIVKFLHTRPLVEAVLDVGADHRRGVLRTQRERGLVAVREGVHFLGDDIGFFADAAGKKLRLFENRGTDFVVIVGAKNRPRGILHAIPHFGRWGQ